MTISIELQSFLKSVISNTPKSFYALLILVVLDYITGVCVAIHNKKISSMVGAKGIASKIVIFAMVTVSAIVDSILLNGEAILYPMTTLFYCVNEIFSVLENANNVGLPLPKKLLEILESFKSKEE